MVPGSESEPAAKGRPPVSNATAVTSPCLSLGCDQLQIGAPPASTSTIQVSVGSFSMRATSMLPEGATAAEESAGRPCWPPPPSARDAVEITCPEGSYRSMVNTAGPVGGAGGASGTTPTTRTASPPASRPPRVLPDEPRAAADEPRAAADDPRAAADEPRAAGDDPRAAADEPRAAGDDPRAAADEPRAAGDDP